MDCLRCGMPMFPVKLNGNGLGERPYLSNKRKGFWENERRSALGCFVCPACGYVELRAEDPGTLILE